MPWRMLLFLVVLTVVVILFAANMENRGSISFIFARLDDVPIFMAVLFAFIAGALTMLPFTTGQRRKGRAIKKKSAEAQATLPEPQEVTTTPPIGAPLKTSPAGGRARRKQKPRRRRRVKRE